MNGSIEILPAGGKITLEIACHVAWTSYGVTPTEVGSKYDACPGGFGRVHNFETRGGAADERC